MSAMDESLLTDSQRVEYSQILRARPIGPLVRRVFITGLALAIVLVCLALVGHYLMAGGYEVLARVLSEFLVAAAFCVAIAVIAQDIVNWRVRSSKARAAEIANFERRISKERRVDARGASQGLPSLRETQHLWYQGRSELTWRDRVIAETYGMDAATYVANFKEAER